MANQYLFNSSLICGLFVIVVALMADANPLLKLSVINGIISSLINHYHTNALYKSYDRLSMTIGFLINLYFIINTNSLPCAVFMTTATALYFTSKKLMSNRLHAGAHVAISICNILLLVSTKK